MAKIVKTIPPMGHNTANNSKSPQSVYSVISIEAIPKSIRAMPKRMFSILCIVLLLFVLSCLYCFINSLCYWIEDRHGEEDEPGGVPITVVEAEVEVRPCCEDGIGEGGESSLEDNVNKRVVEGDCDENYPRFTPAATDAIASEEKIEGGADNGIGNGFPESGSWVRIMFVILILVVIIVIIVTVDMYMLSIGDFNAAEVDLHLITVVRLNVDAFWANLNLGCVVCVYLYGFLGGFFLFLGLLFTEDQLIEGEAVNFRQGDEVICVGACLASLPFRHRLTGNAKLLCQLLLGTLGSTSAQIGNLPNGSRKTGFADVVTDAKTWRDVLGYLGSYLGSYSYIGRDGRLYVEKYKGSSSDTIPSSFRYSSDLSDYRTTYDGLYAIHKESGVQEYVSNTNSYGIVLDLGINPFLQISDNTNRQAALQEIIDAWNGIYYVPFKSNMPLMPHYDVGDVLSFVDNQASIYDIGVITQISYNVNGDMSVTCTGDNPRLSASQDRFSKTVAGLSKDYNNGQETGGKNFWLLHSENTSSMTIGSTKTEVSEIEWNQTVDVMRLGLMFSCEANLSATATVDIELSVDDNANYKYLPTEEKLMLGKRIIGATCGFRVTGKGLHTAKVYLTVTDNPTLWSDLA